MATEIAGWQMCCTLLRRKYHDKQKLRNRPNEAIKIDADKNWGDGNRFRWRPIATLWRKANSDVIPGYGT